MKFKIFSFVAALAVGSSALVMAEGGKIKNPVIIDEDTECVMDVTGVDLEKCISVPAPAQSGIVVFNCDVTVICADDD